MFMNKKETIEKREIYWRVVLQEVDTDKITENIWNPIKYAPPYQGNEQTKTPAAKYLQFF